MAKFSALSPEVLLRLIGTPAAPSIVDVRLNEDIQAIPFLIPTAQRCAHSEIDALVPNLAGKRVVVVCHKGLKLSHGTAALLRSYNVPAEVLEGGAVAWKQAGFPAIPLGAQPKGSPGSLWVTRHRPKIDRIACPWLIRRFIDPSARFLFVPPAEVLAVSERFGATAFDVPNAEWTHSDGACTFDHLLSGFNLTSEPLERMAKVIRGADTNRHDLAPECAGLLAFSVGLSRAFNDDLAQLEAAIPLYDALFRWARDGQGEGHDWRED